MYKTRNVKLAHGYSAWKTEFNHWLIFHGTKNVLELKDVDNISPIENWEKVYAKINKNGKVAYLAEDIDIIWFDSEIAFDENNLAVVSVDGHSFLMDRKFYFIFDGEKYTYKGDRNMDCVALEKDRIIYIYNCSTQSFIINCHPDNNSFFDENGVIVSLVYDESSRQSCGYKYMNKDGRTLLDRLYLYVKPSNVSGVDIVKTVDNIFHYLRRSDWKYIESEVCPGGFQVALPFSKEGIAIVTPVDYNLDKMYYKGEIINRNLFYWPVTFFTSEGKFLIDSFFANAENFKNGIAPVIAYYRWTEDSNHEYDTFFGSYLNAQHIPWGNLLKKDGTFVFKEFINLSHPIIYYNHGCFVYYESESTNEGRYVYVNEDGCIASLPNAYSELTVYPEENRIVGKRKSDGMYEIVVFIVTKESYSIRHFVKDSYKVFEDVEGVFFKVGNIGGGMAQVFEINDGELYFNFYSFFREEYKFTHWMKYQEV